MDPIKFLIDEKKVRNQEELKNILELFDDRKYRMKHLSRFIRAMFLVTEQKAKKKGEEFAHALPLPVKEKIIAEPLEQRIKVVEKIVRVRETFPLPKPPAPHEIIFEEREEPAAFEKPKEYENSFQLVEGKLPLTFTVKIANNMYNLSEPLLNQDIIEKAEEFFKSFKKEDILNDKTMMKKVKKMFKKIKEDFNEAAMHNVQYYLLRNRSLGKVEPLLHDPSITNILCENGEIRVEHKECGTVKTSIKVDAEEIDDILGKIAESVGKEISEDMPMLVTDYREFKVNATVGFGNVPSTFSIKRS